jgi:hypothetical protein
MVYFMGSVWKFAVPSTDLNLLSVKEYQLISLNRLSKVTTDLFKTDHKRTRPLEISQESSDAVSSPSRGRYLHWTRIAEKCFHVFMLRAVLIPTISVTDWLVIRRDLDRGSRLKKNNFKLSVRNITILTFFSNCMQIVLLLSSENSACTVTF